MRNDANEQCCSVSICNFGDLRGILIAHVLTVVRVYVTIERLALVDPVLEFPILNLDQEIVDCCFS
jgi:hypothetical protein